MEDWAEHRDGHRPAAAAEIVVCIFQLQTRSVVFVIFDSRFRSGNEYELSSRDSFTDISVQDDIGMSCWEFAI